MTNCHLGRGKRAENRGDQKSKGERNRLQVEGGLGGGGLLFIRPTSTPTSCQTKQDGAIFTHSFNILTLSTMFRGLSSNYFNKLSKLREC